MARKAKYTTSDLAKEFGVTSQTIRDWLKTGELEKRGFKKIENTKSKSKILCFKKIADDKKEVETPVELSAYDLKEKHLEIKIKKEEQQIYEFRMLLAEKIKDVFLYEYHSPIIMELTELVKKYGDEELIKKWNAQRTTGLKEKQKKLQEALLNIVKS